MNDITIALTIPTEPESVDNNHTVIDMEENVADNHTEQTAADNPTDSSDVEAAPVPDMPSRLKQIRKDHKLSTKSIASSLFISQSLWSSYESSTATPTPTILWYIQCVYHVNEEWLTTGIGPVYEEGYTPGDELGKVMDYTEKMKLDAMKFGRELGVDKVKKQEEVAKLLAEALK